MLTPRCQTPKRTQGHETRLLRILEFFPPFSARATQALCTRHTQMSKREIFLGVHVSVPVWGIEQHSTTVLYTFIQYRQIIRTLSCIMYWQHVVGQYWPSTGCRCTVVGRSTAGTSHYTDPMLARYRNGDWEYN